MEILHGSSWLGPREEYTKYLASSLNLVSMEMRTSCLEGIPAPMLLLIIWLRAWAMDNGEESPARLPSTLGQVLY